MLNERFKSLADYLGRQKWYQKMDMIDVSLVLSTLCERPYESSKADNYGDIFLNEEHRVIFTDFTSGAYLAWSLCLRLTPRRPAVFMRDDEDPDQWNIDLPTRLMHLLARPASLQKENLWEIYECLYWFLGHTMQFEVRYPRLCRYYLGCFEKWRVSVDLEEWVVQPAESNALENATLWCVYGLCFTSLN